MVLPHYLEIFHSKIKYEKKQIDLSNAILIHGGGWKKMVDEQVDNVKFKKILKTKFKIKKVYNYYGMVEQTGSIYLECEEGHLHTNSFNDIIIRDQNTLEPKKFNHEGIIQVISITTFLSRPFNTYRRPRNYIWRQ